MMANEELRMFLSEQSTCPNKAEAASNILMKFTEPATG